MARRKPKLVAFIPTCITSRNNFVIIMIKYLITKEITIYPGMAFVEHHKLLFRVISLRLFTFFNMTEREHLQNSHTERFKRAPKRCCIFNESQQVAKILHEFL